MLIGALALTAKPTNAYAELIEIETAGNGPESPEQWYERAVAIAPYSVAVVEARFFSLHPKWGGSVAARARFVESVAQRLEGEAARDWVLTPLHAAQLEARTGDRKDADAQPIHEEATRRYPLASTYNALGENLWRLDRHDDAIVAFARAIELNPNWDRPWRSRGALTIEKDPAAGFADYLAAAARGNADAQVFVGQTYASGAYKVPRDRASAFFWYAEAANQGNQEGMNMLARAYYDGFDGGRPNDDAAWRWWRESERRGDTQAKADIAYARNNNRLPADAALRVDPAPEPTVAQQRRGELDPLTRKFMAIAAHWRESARGLLLGFALLIGLLLAAYRVTRNRY